MADVARVEREARAQMDQRFLPFLWDYIPIVTLDLNTLPEYDEYALERSRFPSRLPGTVKVSPLRERGRREHELVEKRVR